MGGPITGVQYRGVALHEAERTICFTLRGHVTKAEVTRLLRTGHDLIVEAPHAVTGILWDATEHESHDPAVVSMGIRWAIEHRTWFRRSALVTRSSRLATLVHIGTVMCPWMESAVFPTKEEALVWLSRAMPAPAPASRRGGRRRVA